MPLPTPLAPELMVIQPAPLTAVHGQLVPAVTVTAPAPPCALNELFVGEIAYVQAPGGEKVVALTTSVYGE